MRLAAWKTRPLHFPELLGYARVSIARSVDHDRHQEGRVIGHVQCPADRQIPFAPEVPLFAAFSVGRDDRQKQPAVLDLPPDRSVPGLTPAQLALIEPDLEPALPQRIGNAARRLSVLGRVAQEYALRGGTGTI